MWINKAAASGCASTRRTPNFSCPWSYTFFLSLEIPGEETIICENGKCQGKVLKDLIMKQRCSDISNAHSRDTTVKTSDQALSPSRSPLESISIKILPLNFGKMRIIQAAVPRESSSCSRTRCIRGFSGTLAFPLPLRSAPTDLQVWAL